MTSSPAKFEGLTPRTAITTLTNASTARLVATNNATRLNMRCFQGATRGHGFTMEVWLPGPECKST